METIKNKRVAVDRLYLEGEATSDCKRKYVLTVKVFGFLPTSDPALLRKESRGRKIITFKSNDLSAIDQYYNKLITLEDISTETVNNYRSAPYSPYAIYVVDVKEFGSRFTIPDYSKIIEEKFDRDVTLSFNYDVAGGYWYQGQMEMKAGQSKDFGNSVFHSHRDMYISNIIAH
jgi:hypothetical protein